MTARAWAGAVAMMVFIIAIDAICHWVISWI
jgi:hypothetical protein